MRGNLDATGKVVQVLETKITLFSPLKFYVSVSSH